MPHPHLHPSPIFYPVGKLQTAFPFRLAQLESQHNTEHHESVGVFPAQAGQVSEPGEAHLRARMSSFSLPSTLLPLPATDKVETTALPKRVDSKRLLRNPRAALPPLPLRRAALLHAGSPSRHRPVLTEGVSPHHAHLVSHEQRQQENTSHWQGGPFTEVPADVEGTQRQPMRFVFSSTYNWESLSSRIATEDEGRGRGNDWTGMAVGGVCQGGSSKWDWEFWELD
jgi:hypothetical protein